VIEAILGSVTGKHYSDLLNEQIILPLGLKNTRLAPGGLTRARLVADYHGENGKVTPDIQIAWPAYSVVHGNLYSSANDLAIFLQR